MLRRVEKKLKVRGKALHDLQVRVSGILSSGMQQEQSSEPSSPFALSLATKSSVGFAMATVSCISFRDARTRRDDSDIAMMELDDCRRSRYLSLHTISRRNAEPRVSHTRP